MRWLDRRPDVHAVAQFPVGKSLVEIEQDRRVPRADPCCPIEGCGRLEDEGHQECPLFSHPRTTLGLNARFEMTDEQ
jgi:hypothetical protein